MRRSIVVAAVLALAVFAASAQAAPEPEFGRCVKAAPLGTGGFSDSGCTEAVAGTGNYNWVPGPGPKPGFTQVIKSGTVAIFQTIGGQSITCTGYAGSGEVSDLHRVQMHAMTFTGCHEPSGAPCRAGTLTEGTIEIIGLQGQLGVIATAIEPKKNKIGLNFFHFDEGIECGASSVGLIGEVVVPVKANKMFTKETRKFTQSKGKQKPAGFEGEPHTLEMSFTPGYEQAGLGLTLIETNEEPFEASSVL